MSSSARRLLGNAEGPRNPVRPPGDASYTQRAYVTKSFCVVTPGVRATQMRKKSHPDKAANTMPGIKTYDHRAGIITRTNDAKDFRENNSRVPRFPARFRKTEKVRAFSSFSGPGPIDGACVSEYTS